MPGSEQIQWYPGHMTKAKRELINHIALVDVVVELLDARIPFSSQNPDIDKLAGNKKRIIVLNKADLANATVTTLWENHFRGRGFFVFGANSKTGGRGKLREYLDELMRERIENQKKRGRINISTKAMIVGIPNVGKSTLINQLAGAKSTRTSDRPGVTRGRQWVKTLGGIDLLDTPGILWPKFEDPKVGLHLAITGAISDNVLDIITLAREFLGITRSFYPAELEKRYKIERIEENQNLLELIGGTRGYRQKGGGVDLERTAVMIIDEFRGGKLGRISLEKPETGSKEPGGV
jgi:ribosome biogenesis GTPase A